MGRKVVFWIIGFLVMVAGIAAFALTAPAQFVDLVTPRSGYTAVTDLAYGDNPRQKLDLYVPENAAGAPVMVFFYGGSWQGGSKAMYRALGQTFASLGIVVAVADYRVFPEVRYPAFMEDGARAFRFVHDSVARYGGDPGRMVLAGHSAGGYIAAMLAMNRSYLQDAGADPAWVKAVVGIAGPYDFIPLQDPALITIFGGDRRPETQPITYADDQAPPMFLAYGADDTTVLPRNSERLTAKLRALGRPVELKVYPGLGHVGLLLTLAPGYRWRTDLRARIAAFVNALPRQ